MLVFDEFSCLQTMRKMGYSLAFKKIDIIQPYKKQEHYTKYFIIKLRNLKYFDLVHQCKNTNNNRHLQCHQHILGTRRLYVYFFKLTQDNKLNK